MEDVNISKYRASVVREGSKPASPGFVVSEGQSPTDPAGSGQNHLPVTITPEATGLSITENQVLGGTGTVAQYIRGDGSLADFPESSGGGSSVSYYLNGSVNQGTIGGVAYKELNKVPILGAGTDFTINANGYIASFLTDAGDPNLLEIPGGNWTFETYFSANFGGGSPRFYVELYKYDGTTFTLIASNSTFPELIAFGTNVTAYFSTLAVPTTTLALTDRLAIRYYVIHSGRTIKLHTEDNHLCQIITTFTTGLTALNGLTAQVQNFAVGTSGTDFNIASATATHTFNLPTASATNRGALSSADWTTFNNKENAITAGTTAQYFRGDKTFQTLNTSVVPELTNLYYTEARVNANANVAANTAARHNAVTLGTANGLSLSTQVLSLGLASAGVTGALSGTDWSTFNAKQNALGYTPVPETRTITINGTTQDLSANRTFNVGTVTSVGLSSATSGVTIGSTPVTTSGTITLAIATASGSQNGLLSSTDWSTFNSKQNALTNPVTGTGTTNYLAKFTGSTTVGNSQVFDNGTSVFINATTAPGLGSPEFFVKMGTANSYEGILVASSTNNNVIAVAHTGSIGLITTNWGTSGGATPLAFGTSGAEQMRLATSGNFLIGTTTDNAAKLQVSGSATVNGDLGLGIATPLSGGGAAKWLTLEGTSTYSGGIIYSVAGAVKFYHYLDNDGVFAHQGQSGVGQKFITNGSERMSITSSGNVGIGTTSPFARLHVRNSDVNEGTIAIGNNNYPALIYSSASTGEFRFDNRSSAGAGYITFFPNGQQNTLGNEAMRIATSRNVLIGTTSDNGYKLEVSGQIRSFSATPLVLSMTSNPSNDAVVAARWTSGTGMEMRYLPDFAYGYIQNTYQATSGQPYGDIYFRQNVGGTMTTRMTIKADGGNVGIGTTSPQDRLDVNGSIRFRANTPNFTAVTDNAVLDYVPTSIFPTNPTVRLAAIGTASVGAQISFWTGTSSSLAERSRITSDGNFLIGSTTDNGSKLQVNGAIRTAQPVGTTSNGWLLGRALVSGTSTPDRWIRVQIGLEYYDILAVYMGTL